ncbi:unnamed protein product [Phytophthora fragariaefolia]|uniref:Unnamed protein product n=1 Tax=Phytophthora fragariaefolia TaxID=1490495 RepID=A0A9W6X0S7_9STRA|nr:unnamed protein product [Phytophthora fragariaefolia]
MAAVAVRGLVDQPLKGLGELYENSLKAMLVCGLEFYLSASLVASFFQCPDESMQAEQELQTLYTLAWVPLVLSTVLVYGPKLSSAIFPSPDNFERNMLRCKILTWVYAFVFLIWDPDMVVKTGPSLGVSILFCVTDVGRFVMDMKHLTDVEYDENGNSFIIHDKPSLQQQPTPQQPPQHEYQPEQTPRHQPQENRQQSQHQQPQKQDESYTVHVIGGTDQDAPAKSWQNRQKSSAQLVPSSPQKQQPQQQQGPPAPLFGSTNKSGSRRRLGSTRKGRRGKDSELDQSPSAIKSEYVAVLDPDAEKEAAEMIAKKSFTYEF